MPMLTEDDYRMLRVELEQILNDGTAPQTKLRAIYSTARQADLRLPEDEQQGALHLLTQALNKVGREYPGVRLLYDEQFFRAESLARLVAAWY
jgi:hypothetical protein